MLVLLAFSGCSVVGAILYDFISCSDSGCHCHNSEERNGEEIFETGLRKTRRNEMSRKKKPIYTIFYRIAKKVLSPLTNPFHLLASKHHIRELCGKKCSSSKIKVAFLVQMPELWNKIESVYDRMNMDSRFETCLVIVPAYDFVTERIGEYGDELHFFEGIAEDRSKIVAYEDANWKDITTMGFDYLFYQRPYDYYLPKQYKTQNMAKYLKICYIPYGTPDLRKSVMYPDYFFRNIYLGFMDSDQLADEKNKKYRYREHICFKSVGYPLFESVMRLRRDSEYNVVLWTPRWSYAPIIGGSHFFEYNDYMTNRNWENKHLIVRVHPLLWENFEKEGRLTSEESKELRERWEEKNIEIDKNADILATYEGTDILISDRSSIIPLFFLTGRPIIYCPIETDYSSLYLTIMPGLYIAENQEELDAILRMLLNGEDPLLEKRKEIIENRLGNNMNATENIIKTILEDAF